MGPIAEAFLLHKIIRAFRKGDISMSFFNNLFSSGALKSKTVWVGVLQILIPVLTTYVSGGALSIVDLWPVITGVGTILARAAATQPLASK
jgi:hypothetical protein